MELAVPSGGGDNVVQSDTGTSDKEGGDKIMRVWEAPQGETALFNCRRLYKAALRGDWETAEKLFGQDKELTTAIISSRLETPLHVAVGTGKANHFMKNLLELLPDEALALKDFEDETALHYAAKAGNMEAVVMLVNRNPDLQYITNISNRLPVQIATIQCEKEILKYLIRMSKSDVENSPFVGELGVRLLKAVTSSEFFDVAVDLVGKYPALARSSEDDNESAFSSIARMRSAFPDADSSSWWHAFIYSCITPLERTSCTAAADIENQLTHGKNVSFTFTAKQRVGAMIYKAVEHCLKIIGDKKLKHEQALQLVKSLCQKIELMPYEEASDIYHKSIILAATHGLHEIVHLIIETFPTSIFAEDPDNGRNIFFLAARDRIQNVFNLIYNMSDRKFNFLLLRDVFHNNLMHLCAKIAPPHKLDLLPNAALQMQREL